MSAPDTGIKPRPAVFYKPEVECEGVQPQVWMAVGVAAALHLQLFNHPLVVTSLKDGHHMVTSLHYEGLAVDVRVIGLGPQAVLIWYEQIKRLLRPAGYDVLLETSPPHIHIEYQPHEGQKFITRLEDAPVAASTEGGRA